MMGAPRTNSVVVRKNTDINGNKSNRISFGSSNVASLLTGGGRGSVGGGIGILGGASTKESSSKGQGLGTGGLGQGSVPLRPAPVLAQGQGLAPIKESGERNVELEIAKACKQELIDRCNAMAR